MADSKKNKLQKSALAVFAKQGYHQTRIEDIVAKANSGKGTFYLYFQNKEDLVNSLLDDFFKQFNDLHLWVSANLNAETNISVIYKAEGDAILKLLEENKRLSLFILKEGRSISEKISNRINDFYLQQQQQAETSYRKAQMLGLGRKIDPKVAALCVVGGISHIYTQWLEGNIKEPPQQVLQKTLSFYLEALLN